jgi:hypothetical protein
MINPSTLNVPKITTLPSASPVARLSKSKSMLTLSNGVTVKEGLLQAVLEQVSKRHRYLFVGKIYTLRQICGSKFWLLSLGEGDRNQAGICMHELVKQGRVPFVVAETAHEYPIKYHPIFVSNSLIKKEL